MAIRVKGLSVRGFLHSPDLSLESFPVSLQDSIERSPWAHSRYCEGAGEDAPDWSGLLELVLRHVLGILEVG
jgi:hypothetical protein